MCEQSQIAASLKRVTKAYPGTLACHDVSIEFCVGEIHAILGENGAGKSTIVKILAGLLLPDEGTVELRGRPVHLSTPRMAKRAGIGVVHQSGSLIDSLSVKENLLLGSNHANGSQDKSNSFCKANVQLLPQIQPTHKASELSPSARRLVEIHRLLLSDAQILVLDEPTATLTPQESESLLVHLRGLADDGYTIVVVSHKLPEVVKHADRFTVLKSGSVVSKLSKREASSEELVKLIIGVDGRVPKVPELQDLRETAQTTMGLVTHIHRRREWEKWHILTSKPPLVRFRGVCTFRDNFETALQDIDLDLWRGEVIGVAGRPGSGASTLLDLLHGCHSRIATGTVSFAEGKRRKAIGLIPADPKRTGVVNSFSVGDNLALRSRGFYNWCHQIRRKSQRLEFTNTLIERYRITPADATVPVDRLSGGNLRKVVVAREIQYADDLLLAVNPTAGLDIVSAEEVRRALLSKANSTAVLSSGGHEKSCCVVIQSDDIDELSALADRVIVVSRGRIVDQLFGEEITREAIGRALAEIPVNPTGTPKTQERISAECVD